MLPSQNTTSAAYGNAKQCLKSIGKQCNNTNDCEKSATCDTSGYLGPTCRKKIGEACEILPRSCDSHCCEGYTSCVDGKCGGGLLGEYCDYDADQEALKNKSLLRKCQGGLTCKKGIDNYGTWFKCMIAEGGKCDTRKPSQCAGLPCMPDSKETYEGTCTLHDFDQFCNFDTDSGLSQMPNYPSLQCKSGLICSGKKNVCKIAMGGKCRMAKPDDCSELLTCLPDPQGADEGTCRPNQTIPLHGSCAKHAETWNRTARTANYPSLQCGHRQICAVWEKVCKIVDGEDLRRWGEGLQDSECEVAKPNDCAQPSTCMPRPEDTVKGKCESPHRIAGNFCLEDHHCGFDAEYWPDLHKMKCQLDEKCRLEVPPGKKSLSSHRSA